MEDICLHLVQFRGIGQTSFLSKALKCGVFMFSLFYGRLPSETDTEQSTGFLKRYLLPYFIIFSCRRISLIRFNLVRTPDTAWSRSQSFLWIPLMIPFPSLATRPECTNLRCKVNVSGSDKQIAAFFPAQTCCHRGGRADAGTTCNSETRWDNMGH